MSVFSNGLILFNIFIIAPLCYLLALSVMIIHHSFRLAIPRALFVCRLEYEQGRRRSWEVAIADTIYMHSELAAKMNIQLRNDVKPINSLYIYIESRNNAAIKKSTPYTCFAISKKKGEQVPNPSRPCGKHNTMLMAQINDSLQ